MAGLIRQDDIEAVRNAVKIDEIIGEHVALRPAGIGSLKGLCPFHDERTPSFNVRPHLGMFHCFGCGESGDVISFVQKIDHLPFTEAVEMLAAKAGVDPEKVFNAIKGGLAGSTVMNAKAPMMIAHNFEPGFRIDLHIKDLNNALETGHSVGAPLPLTAYVQEILENLHFAGDGSSDHSAIAKYYEKMAGSEIKFEG